MQGALKMWRQRMKGQLDVAVDTVEEFYGEGESARIQEAFLAAAGPVLGLLAGQQLAVRKVCSVQ